MKDNELHRKLIDQYFHAYNQFDIEGMCKNLHEDIQFENISAGKTTHSTKGITEFWEQAMDAKEYFSERKITIISVEHSYNQIETNIHYLAVLAIDLPIGLKVGDHMELNGTSLFKFIDGKIIRIQDIS